MRRRDPAGRATEFVPERTHMCSAPRRLGKLARTAISCGAGSGTMSESSQYLDETSPTTKLSHDRRRKAAGAAFSFGPASDQRGSGPFAAAWAIKGSSRGSRAHDCFLAIGVVSVGRRRRARSWRTSSQVLYRSNSAASDVDLARFGLRIIRAMQPPPRAARRLSAWRCTRPRRPSARESSVANALTNDAPAEH